MSHRIKLNGKVAAAKIITATQSGFGRYEGGLDVVPIAPPELVAPGCETTLDPPVLVRDEPLVVSETPVGAMVVDGSTMPEGPKTTVVPSITAVVLEFNEPAPIL